MNTLARRQFKLALTGSPRPRRELSATPGNLAGGKTAWGPSHAATLKDLHRAPPFACALLAACEHTGASSAHHPQLLLRSESL